MPVSRNTSILFNSDLLADEQGASPPHQWDSENARYHFNLGPTDTQELVLDPATLADEFVAYRLQAVVINADSDATSETPALVTIELVVDGDVVETRVVDPTENDDYLSAKFTAGRDVVLRVQSNSMVAAASFDLIPLNEGEVVVPDEEPEPPVEIPETDSYSLKAFVSCATLANNVDGQVAVVGELSVYAQTFSRDRDLYGAGTNGAISPVNLTVFSSRKDDGVKVEVPTDYSNQLTLIAKWVYEQGLSGIFNDDEAVFRQQLIAEFGSKIANITIGPMVRSGAVWLPEYVVFYFNPTAVLQQRVAGDEYLNSSRIKLWFSDHAFTNQYDEFEISFIAPVDNLDDLFKLPQLVKAQCDARTQTQLFQRIQSVKDGDPETVIRSLSFDYHNPNDPTDTFPTDWTFLIYGAAGDNVDAIKQRLQDWILANSTHTREEWTVRFPDIFTSTEYIIVPMWNQYAVPNRTLEEGVYSPSTNIQTAFNTALGLCAGTRWTNEHIRQHLAVVGCPYKSISLLICGGPENRGQIFSFAKQWPDYMAVTTGSVDFNRMQPATQAWIGTLYALLRTAESMTEFSDIPLGISRLKRVNAQGKTIMYAVASFENIQYLVVSKQSLEEQFPPQSELSQLTLEPDPSETLFTPANSLNLKVNFEADGGRAPYRYAMASPSMVTGTIDADTGYVDITFGSWGEHLLDITVTDADNRTYVGNYTVGAYAN